MGGRRRFWAGQRRVGVGAALVSEVLNINELRQHSVPSPLKIVGSARLRFRTTSVSMRYRYSPCRALTGWGSIIQSPRISRIIRNKTTFRVRSAAGRGRRYCLCGDDEYQLVTITPRAEPPQNSGVGATAF